MRQSALVSSIVIFISICTAAWSETMTATTGDDTFFAGGVVTEPIETLGDTFVSARKSDVRGRAAGDLHVTGYDVTVAADTREDLYAFGGTVVIGATVGEDLTAGGFSVRLGTGSETTGNARLFGNTVTVNGPVEGALTVAARDVVLNARLGSDARIVAQTITFGPNAEVAGTLTYSTQDRIAVPERVAPANRVVFDPFSGKAARDELANWRKDLPMLPTFASVFAGFVISLLFFVALGAVMLSFLPKPLEAMRQTIAKGPGQTLLLGVIGLSMLFGAVPITALTVIGLPFVPIALLVIVVVWTLGYALGAYSVALRIWSGLGGDADPTHIQRLIVFAAAISFIALLNFIPFVGWAANYTLVLLGIGAMTHAVFQYLVGNTGPVLEADLTPMDD